MSTSVDARRRPGIWSYISFSSSPRRRSITLPTRNGDENPYLKEERRRSNGAGILDTHPEGRMTGGQRSRRLKTGGIVAIVLVLLFLFSSSERENVKDLVKGALKMLKL